MALTYFVDNANAPVLNADAYAKLADIELLMLHSDKWASLDTTGKENRIKAATLHIDVWSQYSAARVSVDPLVQTREFPREFNQPDDGITPNPFTIAEQKRRLTAAVRHIIENNLLRTGQNISTYEGGGEIITTTQENIPRQVVQILSPYLA